MKQPLVAKLMALVPLILGALTLSLSADPLGTAFSYQGRLDDGGQAANGIYDFIFVLYATPTNEVPVYSGLAVEDVQVTNGTFTAEVDFQADLFLGDDLWLEVGVRSGDASGDFSTLLPRQHVTATPYAHHARHAAVAETALHVSNVGWDSLENLPPSFADGEDNDTTYAAGAGLILAGGQEFNVDFADDGISTVAARGDHGHFKQAWTGQTNNAPGLVVHNKSNTGIGLLGKNDEYGSGIPVWQGAGVVGDSSTDPGVVGLSNTGPGVYGTITALNGVYDAVRGDNPSATGRGLAGYATSTNGANIGALGQTDSTVGGVGVRGYASASTGTSYGGRFSNQSPGGLALHAFSDKSQVAKFEITNPANTEHVIEARTTGTGNAGRFVSANGNTTRDALVAQQYGNGNGIYASTLGKGNAGHFHLINNHTNNSALYAMAAGAGRALKATTPEGEAVRAETDVGVAVVAKAGTGGTALSVEGGAIRVKGAGVRTSTAVFIHECTSANTAPNPGGNYMTTIDNPLCNNNPNAILFVTPRINLADFNGFGTYEDLAVAYGSGVGRWVLLNTSATDEIGDFDVGDRFNVMVILP